MDGVGSGLALKGGDGWDGRVCITALYLEVYHMPQKTELKNINDRIREHLLRGMDLAEKDMALGPLDQGIQEGVIAWLDEFQDVQAADPQASLADLIANRTEMRGTSFRSPLLVQTQDDW